MVEQIKEFLYFFIHIVIQILRIDEAGQPADSTIRFGPIGRSIQLKGVFGVPYTC